MFLTPTSLPPTTAECIPDPATATVSFVPDEADIIIAIPTVTIENAHNLPSDQYKLLFFVGFFHKFYFQHFSNLLITSGRIISKP